jgi:formylglycine-generating enzyme
MRPSLVLLVLLMFSAPALLDADTPVDQPAMVLIPAGTFVMGKEAAGDDCPPHEVRLSAFFLDRYEVTNAEYLKFCEATKHRLPEFWGSSQYHCGPDFPHYPVVGVSWDDARLYAKWAGKRLPTEAEWEYAGRGGLKQQDYPNGPELDASMANYAGSGREGSLPVGSFAPNGYGLYDMSGNVVEWAADRYSADAYRTEPFENPSGPAKGRFRVIRGGGWHSGITCNRVYYRNALPGNWVDMNVGFRCAKDAR